MHTVNINVSNMKNLGEDEVVEDCTKRRRKKLRNVNS